MWIWAILLGIFIYNSLKKKKVVTPGVIPQRTVNLAKEGIGVRRTSQKFAVIEIPKEQPSEEGKRILELLENTKTNVFLTGKAGTGKSTLLKYFRATTKKNIAVLAPTGVAAINVQGQTVHSFFKFRPQVTLDIVKKRYGKDAEIYKKLDMIIIDEISMVRADLLDCVDRFMRLNGPSAQKPFGGVQLLVIGDLFQLPPIVKNEEELIFRTFYKSPFFFDSQSYGQAGFIKIELTHVYRQNDLQFIDALDAFRVGAFTDEHLSLINTRVVSDFQKPENEFIISLVTKNKIAEEINQSEMAKLLSSPRSYKGSISGIFKDSDLPTALNLILKEGAQVMLLNNDSRGKWVNGDIVKIIKTDSNSVRVLFDDGNFDDVGFNKWESIQFVYDEENKKIQSEVVGTFTQIPIKLAWAVTIHKGQGKTFDRVHIDFGDGTFAPGQAYVALRPLSNA
jgi:ATP-dependent DNA helicase PIF1